MIRAEDLRIPYLANGRDFDRRPPVEDKVIIKANLKSRINDVLGGTPTSGIVGFNPGEKYTCLNNQRGLFDSPQDTVLECAEELMLEYGCSLENYFPDQKKGGYDSTGTYTFSDGSKTQLILFQSAIPRLRFEVYKRIDREGQVTSVIWGARMEPTKKQKILKKIRRLI
ncbi:hypothetical protein C4559_02495 [Candidatus Microgenomates bacterium]|nr:MAG: hypothetical protein C4559_02495 [Candidatus Microgenomates bacterium]